MVSGLELRPTAIPEIIEILPRVFADERGFFLESWNARSFRDAGLDITFLQDNHSRSSRGVLRGLHYQNPAPQGKLVRVVRGEVFDVAVDLRQSAPTFGHWVGVWLSEGRHNMLWIPPGFAHGFYVTSELADLLYRCTDHYVPAAEHTLRWDDPDVGIEWPLDRGGPPVLSAKDLGGKSLADAEVFP